MRELKVEKLECVGHVQKRVGTRLGDIKKRTKGLGGKGKLTDSIIDRLQNYYGIAIRSNRGDLEGMKKAVWASLFYVASSASNNYYVHCPVGSDSWCLFQKDGALGTNLYKPGAGLPLKVIAELKPIYRLIFAEKMLTQIDAKLQRKNSL